MDRQFHRLRLARRCFAREIDLNRMGLAIRKCVGEPMLDEFGDLAAPGLPNERDVVFGAENGELR